MPETQKIGVSGILFCIFLAYTIFLLILQLKMQGMLKSLPEEPGLTESLSSYFPAREPLL